jgi:hypothetical protein
MKKCFMFAHHPFLLVVLMTVVGSLWPSSIAAPTLLLLRISDQTVCQQNFVGNNMKMAIWCDTWMTYLQFAGSQQIPDPSNHILNFCSRIQFGTSILRA